MVRVSRYVPEQGAEGRVTAPSDSCSDNVSKPPVLCIVGPTGTGKSDLGIEVARAVNGEILSADSMQVYKGMDIGTAKVMPDEMQGVPHHLLDIVSPNVRFTVADWVQCADAVIRDVHARGRLPIVVGGTGLYIRSIIEDLSFAQEGSEEVRERWANYLAVNGAEALHKELAQRDAASAARLHVNDTRRVIRALEVFEVGQRPLSSDYEWKDKGGRYNTVQFGLTASREMLYERVNVRVDRMMEKGLVEEVRRLYNQGYTLEHTSMQAIGYKEILGYITGEVPLADAVDQLKRATRRFVKRQLSWFLRDERVHWLRLDEKDGIPSKDMEMILATATEMLAGIERTGLE